MITHDPQYEWRQHIFREVKQYFIQKLGKFTHHKAEPDYHFRGMAFVSGELGYVFGFNIGFFRTDKSLEPFVYDSFGANVLVRTNGIEIETRLKYKDFFDKHLKNWINQTPTTYTGPRNDVGVLYPRYAKIVNLKDEQIIDFLKISIEELSKIYNYIIDNPDGIFTNVVRATPPWDDYILELALEKINQR